MRTSPIKHQGSTNPTIVVTLFYNHSATRKTERSYGWDELRTEVLPTTKPDKKALPWVKLARFGDVKSDKGSLRHDANVLAISGIEADYDGEVMTPAEAVEKLEKAGIRSLVYTSPSYTEDAPRWRILCPTSTELPPARRAHLVGRLNGLFGGILASESFTLSQSYYYGRVGENPSHMAELVDGQLIDLCDELDTIWMGRPASTGSAGNTRKQRGKADTAELFAEIVSGAGYHAACVRLGGVWARGGVPLDEARARIASAFEAVPVEQQDARWTARRNDVGRCLEDMYRKEARRGDDGQDHEEQSRGSDAAATGWPEPIDFLSSDQMTGLPVMNKDHLPAALYDFAIDTADRMGVDPVGVVVCALVACASVMSEEWQLQPKQHDSTWTEAARIWGGLVGDPSVLKTPIIAACTRPIDALDIAAREAHAEADRFYKQALRAWKEAGSDADTKPTAPRLPRYLVEGTTVEALSEVLRDDPEARYHAPAGRVLLRQDELGEFIAGFDRYRAGGRGGADRGAYLRLYNGGRFTIDRVGRGGFAIPSWSACILGGIQPEPIQRIASESVDDGLLQRFIFCLPGPPHPGQDRVPNQAAIARYAALFPALVALHPARRPHRGAGDQPWTAQVVVLNSEAHRHRSAIDHMIDAVSALPDTSSRLKSSLAKWRGLFARITLAFHLINIADARAQGDVVPILHVTPAATAAQVEGFMREILLPHLMRADALMFSTVQTGHARWIAGHILTRGYKRIGMRDVVQAYGPLRAPEKRRELLDVMESLVTVGWLIPEEPANPSRPPPAWAVNPAVHTQFAARASQERARRAEARRQAAENRAEWSARNG